MACRLLLTLVSLAPSLTLGLVPLWVCLGCRWVVFGLLAELGCGFPTCLLRVWPLGFSPSYGFFAAWGLTVGPVMSLWWWLLGRSL